MGAAILLASLVVCGGEPVETNSPAAPSNVSVTVVPAYVVLDREHSGEDVAGTSYAYSVAAVGEEGTGTNFAVKAGPYNSSATMSAEIEFE